MENNAASAKTAKGKPDKRKLVTTIVTAAALAFIAIFLWTSAVAVDPFDYVTIAFDGARPFLIPKVEVSKKAPKGIKASDFTFTAEHSRKNKKKLTILADEGQVFTVKFKGKNNLLKSRFYSKRKKLYKVGSTPKYVRDTADLTGYPDGIYDASAAVDLEKQGEKFIVEDKELKCKSASYIGMYTLLNERYDDDSDFQQEAFLAYSGKGKVILVELSELTIDGKYEVRYDDGYPLIWTFDSLQAVWDSGLLNSRDQDLDMDDEVNVGKINDAIRKANDPEKKEYDDWYLSRGNIGGSSHSYSNDDYDSSDHDDEGYYDDYSSDFSSQDDADDGMEDDYDDGDIDDDDY